jgi:hypothetical protein
MAERKRKTGRTRDKDEALRQGFEAITARNADEQFAKFLAVLDRIERVLFDLASIMRSNRREIEMGLDRIGRKGDEIDRLLAGMRHG